MPDVLTPVSFPHDFKVQYFHDEYPDRLYPEVFGLQMLRILEIRRKVTEKLDLPASATDLQVFLHVEKIQKAVGNFTKDSEFLDLPLIFAEMGSKTPDFCYLTFKGFGEMFAMRTADIADNISDIWYPSSDDLTIFPEHLECFLDVRHWGEVRGIRLPPLR